MEYRGTGGDRILLVHKYESYTSHGQRRRFKSNIGQGVLLETPRRGLSDLNSQTLDYYFPAQNVSKKAISSRRSGKCCDSSSKDQPGSRSERRVVQISKRV